MSIGLRAETLTLTGDDGAVVGSLTIFCRDPRPESLNRISFAEAAAEGEEPVQIVEGRRYEFAVEPSELRLGSSRSSGIVEKSSNPALQHCGSIVPRSYTGRLALEAFDESRRIIGRAAVEVRSRKISYREDYRRMLEDIGERCVSLLADLRSPVTSFFAPDPGRTVETVQQRFEFLRGLIGSRRFRDAVERVAHQPHLRRLDEDAMSDIRRGARLDRRALRTIASTTRRVGLPDAHPARALVSSLPERTEIRSVRATSDTPENRFVKFVLGNFAAVLASISHRLREIGRPDDARLIAEVDTLEGTLAGELARDVFRRIGQPNSLPLGSAVLQRREGYREIYRAWLQFQLGSRIVWCGGDDVYGRGKRDVATLYEYWVFFELLRIASKLFHFEQPPARDLIESTADGFGLRLRAGQRIDLVGLFRDGKRPLRVRFSYNREFAATAGRASSGSWSVGMRPDYTFSFWPAEFTEDEAEEQELMVHLHFDAKYRIDTIFELFGAGEGGRDDELRRTTRREDLLKMHAYRDAIRRSHGAYVIYPGDSPKQFQGFHEILPGLGAFVARPGEDGSNRLESFIAAVVDHASDRATARERQTYHVFDAQRASREFRVFERLPERRPGSSDRERPPAETFVLVGWCKSEEHLAWILREGLYNFRMDSGAGSLQLTPDVVAARYLLLHHRDLHTVDGLLRIMSNGPRVFSREALVRRGYPGSPTGDYYLVYDVEPAHSFAGRRWDAARIASWPPGRLSAWPFALRLDEVLASEA